MITGVRFVLCTNHPDRVARQWHGEGDDRKPYCSACLQSIRDAQAVAYIESKGAAATAAVAALHAALREGHDRKAGSARRRLRDWTGPDGVRATMRHLQRIIATQPQQED